MNQKKVEIGAKMAKNYIKKKEKKKKQPTLWQKQKRLYFLSQNLGKNGTKS